MNIYTKAKGYVRLIAILIVTIVIALWFAYIWKKQWFTGINLNLNGKKQEENKNVNQQLDDLRGDMNQLQKKRDQEIYNEINDNGNTAAENLDQNNQ